MKHNQSVVRRESLYIAVWVILLSCLMEAVFLIVGKWSLTVLWGNLLSGGVAVLNFYLMGITVETAVLKEEKEAVNFMKLSQTLRMFMTFAAVAVGVLLPYFHIVSLLLPLFFPRIAIIFRPMLKNLDADEAEQSTGGDSK